MTEVYVCSDLGYTSEFETQSNVNGDSCLCADDEQVEDPTGVFRFNKCHTPVVTDIVGASLTDARKITSTIQITVIYLDINFSLTPYSPE